jgi:hypothetical protein
MRSKKNIPLEKAWELPTGPGKVFIMMARGAITKVINNL